MSLVSHSAFGVQDNGEGWTRQRSHAAFGHSDSLPHWERGFLTFINGYYAPMKCGKHTSRTITAAVLNKREIAAFPELPKHVRIEAGPQNIQAQVPTEAVLASHSLCLETLIKVASDNPDTVAACMGMYNLIDKNGLKNIIPMLSVELPEGARVLEYINEDSLKYTMFDNVISAWCMIADKAMIENAGAGSKTYLSGGAFQSLPKVKKLSQRSCDDFKDVDELRITARIQTARYPSSM